MQKRSQVVLFSSLLFLIACNEQEHQNVRRQDQPESQVEFFPVTEFIMGQLKEISQSPVTPVRINIIEGRSDSTWMKRDEIGSLAEPFLHPVIDSISMSKYFEGKAFLDQTINAYTFSYDPKTKLPDTMRLRHWDVYIDPQKNVVQRIYIVKEDNDKTVPVSTQLTWKSGKWYSIRTIAQLPGKEPVVKEQIVKWDFNDEVRDSL